MKSDLHFKESNITFLKLFVFLLISITFLFFDKDLSYGNKVRDNLSYLIEPVYNLANYPSQISESMKTFFKTKNDLINENNNLKKKIQIQSGIIQKLPSLTEENKRLKKLLDSSTSVSSAKILLVELIRVNLNPFSNKVIINQGREKNLYIGQPVIDSTGILGQISEINETFSVVTLITDPGHALLGVNTRTNKRIVISGTGDNRKLKAKYIALNEDVIEGDSLITSGLDNVFPEGYLIGKISKIKKNINQDFLDVIVVPSSALSSNREVMVLW